jgi:hypothetical protein
MHLAAQVDELHAGAAESKQSSRMATPATHSAAI